MRAYLLISSIVLLSFACGQKKDFKGAVAEGNLQKKDPPVTPATPDPKLVEKSEDFVINKSSGLVDLVWVIDNSGSMEEEANQVRQNLSKFMGSISAAVDLKVTLISNKDSEFGVTLGADDEAKGHKQLEIDVGSRNLLEIAASAICPKDQTFLNEKNRSNNKICGESFTNKFEGIADAGLAAGGVAERLRPNASKILVFVTDDDANSPVNANNFMQLTKLNAADTHVFAFRGLSSREDCDISRQGKAYEALAQSTKGEVFDICETDWSPQFSKLSSSVIQIAKNSYKLTAGADVTIKNVLLDGVEVPQSGYSFINGEIKIVDQEALTKAQGLRVVYEIKE